MPDAPRRVIVVLGMHRSGTSVLARAFPTLGIELGDDLMPASPANPRGYWEDRAVVEINEAVLAALGRSWLSCAPIDDSGWQSSELARLADEAGKLLASRLDRFGIWAFKDPRTCRLLPFWQPIFAHLGLEDCYAISLRNPLAVARSLYQRDRMELEPALLLWLEHMLEAFVHTANKPRVMVDYDAMLEAPVPQLTRLARILRLPVPDQARLDEFAHEFLDPNLRHHTLELQPADSDAPLARLALEGIRTFPRDGVGPARSRFENNPGGGYAAARVSGRACAIVGAQPGPCTTNPSTRIIPAGTRGAESRTRIARATT